MWQREVDGINYGRLLGRADSGEREKIGSEERGERLLLWIPNNTNRLHEEEG